MAIPYGELKKRILLKIDEYEAEAEGMTEDEDIIARMPDVINESVRFVFYSKSHNKTWNVKQGAPINALEPVSEDSTELFGEHRTTPVVYEAEDVYEYFFEVDDTATVEIYVYDADQADWVLYKTEGYTNPNPYSEYVSYKGFLSDDHTPVKAKIVFTGNYYYKYRNVCLHNVAYDAYDKIPAYTGYRQHDIPKNLYQIVECYTVNNGERKNLSYYTEDDKLYLPDVEGTIYLVSKFFPDPVDANTPDDYVIDIPVDTEWIVVNKASAIFMQEGEYQEFIADEEQGMQMLEGDRGRSRAPRVVRFR